MVHQCSAERGTAQGREREREKERETASEHHSAHTTVAVQQSTHINTPPFSQSLSLSLSLSLCLPPSLSLSLSPSLTFSHTHTCLVTQTQARRSAEAVQCAAALGSAPSPGCLSSPLIRTGHSRSYSQQSQTILSIKPPQPRAPAHRLPT